MRQRTPTIPMEIALGSPSEESSLCQRSASTSTRLERLRARREANASRPPPSHQQVVLRWILFYFILWLILTICTSYVLGMESVIREAAKMVVWVFLLDTPRLVWRRERPSFGRLFGVALSLFLFYNSYFYTKPFHLIHPCHKLDLMIQELTTNATTLSLYPRSDDARRPLQAMGLDNADILRLSDALTIHFDRCALGGAKPLVYVQDLNLIANSFDATGVEYLLQALQHKYAYTDQLLLGRNRHLGDDAAFQLAHFIQEHTPIIITDPSKDKDNQPPSGKYLTWLEFGSTSVTPDGLKALYKAAGSRPMEYLGLTYMDSWWPRLPAWMGQSPIPYSIPGLHQAKQLQEISLVGNSLKNQDMITLTQNVLGKTNITKLYLINNRIGDDGVEHLLPLTKQLKELHLGINWRIGTGGAQLLTDALKEPDCTLELLSLFECRIGQEGAEALLSAFPQNTKLTFLGVDGQKTGIRPETLKALQKAVEANWYKK